MKVGILGLGNFGRLHAATTGRLEEANVTALVDANGASFEQLDQSLSDVPRWTDLESALRESETEAWIVATSTSSHVALTEALLSAGKSVLLEKPIAEDLASAETLRDCLVHSQGRLMLGHVALFNSEFRQLQEEANSRGSIEYIDCVRHRPSSTKAAFPGESPFHLTMVHDLYLVQALKKGEEPVSLTSRSHSDVQGQCDLALAQLQWKDGSIASLTASFLTPGGMASEGFDRMEVFGRNWSARIHPNPRPIQVWDENRTLSPLTLEVSLDEKSSVSGMLAEQMRTFLRVVRNRQSIPAGASLEDGLQIQRWLDALAKNNPNIESEIE